MSILIKGMEMPTRCADCPFEYDSMLCKATGKSFIYRSAAEGGYIDFCDTRMPDCPLIEISSADVAHVVHGMWIPVGHKLSRICSVCDRDEPYKFADDNANVYDYCPHCGAKMDLLN